MKNITQRRLPLNVTYTLINKQYVSILDGYGCSCDNCGKLIANIATINSNGKSYNIGFDCLDTILLNNAVLSQIDIQDYQAYKVALNKVMKLIKRIKEVLKTNTSVSGIRFEKCTYKTDYHTFYWVHGSSNISRDNDNEKIKGVTTEVVYNIISSYFKNLNITIV